MPGNMKQFPTSPESDVLHKATKEIKSEIKKTDDLPEGNDKIKVLESEMKETASFYEKSKSISNILESMNDKSQVSLDWREVETESFLQHLKWTKVYF